MFALEALTPAALSDAASQATTVTGAALSLVAVDYDEVVVIQNIGAITGTIAGKIQDSADGSTGWADLAGATFASVGSANNTQSIAFPAYSTRGFVRYVGTITTGPAVVSVTLLGRRKN